MNVLTFSSPPNLFFVFGYLNRILTGAAWSGDVLSIGFWIKNSSVLQSYGAYENIAATLTKTTLKYYLKNAYDGES